VILPQRRPAPLRPAILLATPLLALTACAGGSTVSSASSPTPSAQVGRTGVVVSGKFGTKPSLTIPSTAAPTQLSAEVLSEGTGAQVVSGQTLVANYLGETWDLKAGKPNVFDNSYDRKQPAGFPIGVGAVIKGWDQALVGQTAGSRVLLVIPPNLAYDASKAQTTELAGHTLVFVVDIIGSLNKGTSATGTVVRTAPAGYPKVNSASGKKPVITSVKGVKVGKAPTSVLLIKGTGVPIDPAKNLALEVIEIDLKTGKETQRTWDIGPEIVPAQQVLKVVTALKGQRVGSRAIAVTPSQDSSVGVAVLVDVIAQY